MSYQKIQTLDVQSLLVDRPPSFTSLLSFTGNKFGLLKPIETSHMSPDELQLYNKPEGSIFIGNMFILTTTGDLFLRKNPSENSLMEIWSEFKKVEQLLEFIRKIILDQDTAWRLVNIRLGGVIRPLPDEDRYSFFPEEYLAEVDKVLVAFGGSFPTDTIKKADFISLPSVLANVKNN